MLWNSNLESSRRGTDNDLASEIDRMARRLATLAGADWDSMNNYPGFERNRWREHAEQLLKLLN